MFGSLACCRGQFASSLASCGSWADASQAHERWVLQGQDPRHCFAGSAELVEGQHLWKDGGGPGSHSRLSCSNGFFLQVLPKLRDSLQSIIAQRVQLPSKKEELLGNFKLSVRGSIRKAPNVVPDPELPTSKSLILKIYPLTGNP